MMARGMRGLSSDIVVVETGIRHEELKLCAAELTRSSLSTGSTPSAPQKSPRKEGSPRYGVLSSPSADFGTHAGRTSGI